MNVVCARAASGATLLALAAGCGSNGNSSLQEVGTYGDDSGTFGGGGTSAAPLDAAIEEDHVLVKLVTVSCAGQCATVEAVAMGGHPPYTFAWDDGTTSAARRVCPTADRTYVVRVTDTGATGEIARPAETVVASLAADVLACPEGGTGDAGFPGAACVSDPSFEGTAALTGFDAPPWVACGSAISGQDRIWNATTASNSVDAPPPAPADGTTYAVLAGSQGFGAQFLAEPVCGPLHAGASYSLRIDLAGYLPQGDAGDPGPPPGLQIWAATSACSEGQLLWTSPLVAYGAGWSSYCATFTPTAETTYLALSPYFGADGGGFPLGSLCVDHIVPVESCP